MTIRQVGEQDRDGWAAIVSSSPDSTYAHTWEWLRLYESHLPVKVLALAGEGRGGFVGAYGGILDEAKTHAFLRFVTGNRVLWSPHELTWDYGGPCFDPEIRRSLALELIKAMEVEARRMGAWCLRISPFASRVGRLLRGCGYKPRERLTSIVALTKGQDRLWKGLRKTFRHCVRKAEMHGLDFELGQGPSILPEFLECLGQLASQKGFEMPPPEFLRGLLNIDVDVLRPFWSTVRDTSGALLAVGIFLSHKNMTTMRWNGVTPKGRTLMANHLLVWRTITWALDEGFTCLDLGGLPSDRTDGIYRFKMGLGGEIRHVDWYVKHLAFGTLVRFMRRLSQPETPIGH